MTTAQIKIKIECNFCGGTGGSYHMCERCKGKGTITTWISIEEFVNSYIKQIK